MLLPHHSWDCLKADVWDMSHSLAKAGKKVRGREQAFLSFSRVFIKKVFQQNKWRGQTRAWPQSHHCCIPVKRGNVLCLPLPLRPVIN